MVLHDLSAVDHLRAGDELDVAAGQHHQHHQQQAAPAPARGAQGYADVTIAEIHDCFTVMGGIGTEVIGKAEAGKGLAYWKDGKAAPKAECGINTSGGLIAKGHPVGATGARIMVTLLNALKQREKTLGLATLCGGGGVSMACALEMI